VSANVLANAEPQVEGTAIAGVASARYTWRDALSYSEIQLIADGVKNEVKVDLLPPAVFLLR
jgi:hypothetical protein